MLNTLTPVVMLRVGPAVETYCCLTEMLVLAALLICKACSEAVSYLTRGLLVAGAGGSS